jgi:Flp pilus assembly protein TadG
MKSLLRRREKGSAAIELAIAIPTLMLILLGTADFGRLYYEAIAVENAARCGAQFAVVTSANHNDFAGIRQAALNELQGLSGATATVSQMCRCGWGQENDCSSGCSSKRTYVQVTVSKTFNTLAPYPGIPSSVQLRAVSTMRIK